MDSRKRILVVEDNSNLRESYMANLKMENYLVHGAGSLLEAIEALDLRNYHAAIVDIKLKKKDSKNEGVDVVRYIRQLDEGTETIVLSSMKDQVLERDLLKEHEVFDYIVKADLDNKGGIPHLLKRVKSAIDTCRVDTRLSWETLVGQIGWPIDGDRFTAECLTRLEFKGGFQTLSNALIAACKPVMPLVREDLVDRALAFDEQEGIFRGRFWSKSQGMAIELLFWGRNVSSGTGEPKSVLTGRSILHQPKERAGLSVVIAELSQRSRSDFSNAKKRQ